MYIPDLYVERNGPYMLSAISNDFSMLEMFR